MFPSIFRVTQSGLPVHAGWEPLKGEKLTDRERQANEFLERCRATGRTTPSTCSRWKRPRSALERRKPRVLYVGLGETDEWGHGRRYDLYLDAAHKADRFLAETWQALQKEPQYRGKTALMRDDRSRPRLDARGLDRSRQEGAGAEFVWIAVLGPDTPALGEREKVEVTQSQIAATIAALVGEDFNAASKEAAKPLPVFAKIEALHSGSGWNWPG